MSLCVSSEISEHDRRRGVEKFTYQALHTPLTMLCCRILTSSCSDDYWR